MQHSSTVALVIAAASMAMPVGAQARDYPVRPVPFTAVKVAEGFWGQRLETNRQVTVWYDFRKCEETGRIANFEVAGGLREGGFQGIYFNDSDVVKVIEGAAYTLALHPDPTLEAYVDDLISKIAAAQEADGYLYTARTIGDPSYDFPGKAGGRWSHLGHGHELYNVGHMYEAAVAYWQATGKRQLLEVAIRNADLVCRVFGPRPGQRIDVPGHEEIEIGLVKLYRATGDAKYLEQAKFFIDMRGRADLRSALYGTYCQDHEPVVDQQEAVGHAVRGGYLYAGVADVAAITGNRDYIAAIDRIWNDVVSRKLYLIGSVGQHGAGEGYAGAYKLDNLRAYNETCAAIALALWNHRMFLLHGDSKYIDVLERIIYNGFLSGVSLSGDEFFYPNPLACDMRFRFNQGSLERSPWFGCSCCPVNVVRFLPSIPGYVYATRDDSVYVNLFIAGEARVEVGGRSVKLVQETRYPWEGSVRITVVPEQAGVFALRVREPGWLTRPVPSDLYRYRSDNAGSMRVVVNGEAADAARESGYAVLRRTWRAGDVVELAFELPVRRVLCHDAVVPDRGRVAVERGPLVYCVEGADHDGRVMDLCLDDSDELTPAWRGELLGGVTVLTGRARRAYRADDGSVASRPAGLTMIPYYAWCHRGANEMAVWLPRSLDKADVAPPPTVATTARASASHCWGSDDVGAVNDGVEPASSIDHDVPRLTWWDHRGGTEWVQLDLAAPTRVTSTAVYWFDDTGRGQCRVPASWRLLYRDGSDWKAITPLAGAGYGVERDRYNTVTFEPVTTDALRIEASLQSGFSGGVLEWRLD
ncbi:MAG: glycoside hydrolase family 127 protein [Planctomycetes bacterium]|nr:glycoside hydrolase family 127 protein [Planctomycetota bacterium]